MSWLNNKILGAFVKSNGLLSKPLFGGMGQVFMLHRVLPNHSPKDHPFNHGLAISPEKLSACIEHFQKENYDFISLDEMSNRLKEGKGKKPFVVFTMDDGYIDNFENALPVFEKYQIPFCIYVTTSFPNMTATFWWYLLEDYVKSHNSLAFNIEGEEFSFSWQNNSELKEVYPKIKTAFKKVPRNDFRSFIKTTFNLTDEQLQTAAEKRVMSWKQLSEIAQHPLVTIGSHTVNHFSLKNLSPQEVETEVETAKNELENKLGISVKHFAYPYGGRNDVSLKNVQTISKISGIETAVLNLPGNVFSNLKNSTLLIPRYPLGDMTSIEKFKLQQNGIEHFANNAWNKIIKLD